MTKDPAMLGGTHYARTPLDHYPTPPRATNAFLSIFEDDMEAYQFWEPFVGNGAVANIIGPLCRQSAGTDIHAYEGYDPAAIVDFFNVYRDDDEAGYQKALDKFNGEQTNAFRVGDEEAYNAAVAIYTGLDDDDKKKAIKPELKYPPHTMADVELLLGFRPDCIISNPPYGKLTDKSVRKALELLEPEQGFLALLMRHEWDAAKGRADVIDHPAFLGKITLRFRPVWIEKEEGEKSASPRFSYAWYLWSWSKALVTPHAKPLMFYAI